MARVREGSKAALVVVDMHVGVVKEAWDAPRVIENVAAVVARARSAGVPVLWVQHAYGDELATGTPPWQLVPPLAAATGETSIAKKYNSSFEDTALDAELACLGVSRIVLAGAATNWCIRATAYGALDRGYDLTLVEDAHTTTSMKLDDGATLEAEALVRDLIAMAWLEYPGLRNGTAKARDLGFAAPVEP